MKSIIRVLFTGLSIISILMGCGGSDNSIESSTESDSVNISGAGIKGPLAFADVKIYAFDPSFPDYYDKASPISIAITNQYAEINGLSVPRKIKPPYILTIEGGNGIDLNTGLAPVINTLTTIITDDMLENNRPIFATPLTTLAYHITRLDFSKTQHKNRRAASNAYVENLNNAASLVSSTLTIRKDSSIDIFRSPLIINEYTAGLEEQEQAVFHRAAIEAFAAKVYALAQSGDISSDYIIKNVALDIYNDEIIDGTDNGTLIDNIKPSILNQDPMSMLIPNTSYRIEEIMLLMKEERIQLGTSMGPNFFIDEIAFPEDTTSIDTSYSEQSVVKTTIPSQPIVTISSNSIEFGSLYIGETSNPIEIVLTNSGTAPLNISDIIISTGFTEANNCNNYLPSGGNCIFDIQFSPIKSGLIEGVLTITGNTAEMDHVINLTGTAHSITQSSNDFSPVNELGSEILFNHDFNDEPLHTYTQTDILDTWDAHQQFAKNDSIKIVQDPDPSGSRDHVMRAFYAANTVANKNSSGFYFRTKIGSHDEMYFAYDVYFESDADFTKGGKLPGLGILDYYSSAGDVPDGTDRWTGGLTWRADGKIGNYVYHANQPGKWGEIFLWNDGDAGQVYFKRGEWTRIEIYYKMNTPGVLDGRLQGWINGELALDTNEIMYRMPGGEHLTIGAMAMATSYGGDITFAPSTDQHIYFDNFVVSTQPITH